MFQEAFAKAQYAYEECARQFSEFDAKVVVLRRKALSVAEQIAPLLAQFNKLRSPEIKVVSLKEFGVIRARLREQTKLALSVREEMDTIHTSLKHLKKKLPMVLDEMKRAEAALDSWSNVVPFRGRA